MPSTSRQTRSLSPIDVIQRTQHPRNQRNQPDCRLCKRNHPIRMCRKFNNLNITAKLNVVKKYKYCENCLAHSHLLPKCRSTERCRKCLRKHHTTLHRHALVRPINNSNGNHNQEVNLRQSVILLPTVIINVQLGEEWSNVRGILDPSSGISKIAEVLSTRYRLPTERSGTQRICKLTFKPHFVDSPMFVINAAVTKELPQSLRSEDLDKKIADQYKNMRLADPKFFKSGDINIILGADVYPHIIKSIIHPPTLTTPMAQDTELGWILIGKIHL